MPLGHKRYLRYLTCLVVMWEVVASNVFGNGSLCRGLGGVGRGGVEVIHSLQVGTCSEINILGQAHDGNGQVGVIDDDGRAGVVLLSSASVLK